jgi:protein involved in polysaccharide export with SLBB domain
MRTRSLTITAILFLAASTAAFAQNTSANSTDTCVDAQTGASVSCDTQQPDTDQQNPGSAQSANQNGMAGTASRPTTSGTQEDADIGLQTPRPQTKKPILPPDPLTDFQRFTAATTGQLLPVFGASLFRNVPGTFAPSDLAPVTDEYVIGPGDELRVRIWGAGNYSGNLRVDRTGNIYIPEAGSVHVAGLKFTELDQHLRAAVAHVYRNFDLSVDVGRIRSIQVYVTGQARRPGVYTVSSLSSLVDALFASGGPSPQGSLRHLVLKRAGKDVTDFDLYALLIHGDKSKDVRLEPEDVLYIPPVGAQVALTGSVRAPAIYEMRTQETIGDLIEMAGRLTALASNARMALERVGEDKHRQVLEFAMDASGMAAKLEGGDILKIYSILPSYENTVTLRGNVANPGRYSFSAGMKLSDLIPDKESLQSREYWWKRSHMGLPVPDYEAAIATIGRAPVATESNIEGSFNRSVSQEVLTKGLMANAQPVRESASGSALGTSSSTIASQSKTEDSNQTQLNTVKNTVKLITPEIDWDFAVIERRDPQTLKTSLISFDLGKLVLNHDASQDLALTAGDTVTIFSQSDIRPPLEKQTKYVELAGEFAHGGIYSVEPGETLRDLIKRAGGFTGKAYLYGSEFSRESVRVLQQQRLDEYLRTTTAEADRASQELAAAAVASGNAATTNAESSHAIQQNLVSRLSQIRATGRVVLQFKPESKSVEEVPALNLENGDRFVVPYAPETVNIVGAVYDQNSFLFQHERTVGRYLEIAGGTTRSADKSRTFIIRADGSVVNRASVKGLWGNEFAKLRLNAGDTIVVPEKMLRPTALRTFMDWTQMFSQLAIGAAVASNL